MPANWPDAAKINEVVPSTSPLAGTGNLHVQLGGVYGINPGVVVGTIFKECQYMKAGVDDKLRTANNFGGNTCAAPGAGCTDLINGHNFIIFDTAPHGLEGVFQGLARASKGTDGTLGGVMDVYSPAWDNPDFWGIYTAIGSKLGITLNKQTPVTSGGNAANLEVCMRECDAQFPPSDNALQIGAESNKQCKQRCSTKWIDPMAQINNAKGALSQGVDAATGLYTEIQNLVGGIPKYFSRAMFVFVGLVIVAIAVSHVVKAG